MIVHFIPFYIVIQTIDISFLIYQSDSDPDAPNPRGGIMRPTIASQNRMNGGKCWDK